MSSGLHTSDGKQGREAEHKPQMGSMPQTTDGSSFGRGQHKTAGQIFF
ncbi:hypothetical protein HMPREF1248_0314 [Coriobacteriaceae bacterium BV3Ac1]|nr:hypothetical protein HMPREF1248_0314 [Coriobacteriaceae bacterium BV3Ac1]